MGKPPPHIIFKRVVKSIAKNLVPRNTNELTKAETKLHQCWDLNGVGSSNCLIYERTYRDALAYEKSYQNHLKNSNYEMNALKHLAPATRKYAYKGKYRVQYLERNTNKFDIRNIDLDYE